MRGRALRVSPLVLLLASASAGLCRLAPAGATPARAGAAISCASDDQCGEGTYCELEQGRCQPTRSHINVLYMFYRSRDRSFTEALGLYWHQRGPSGYRVAFPLYWHFWSEEQTRRVVFPLYFDHLDRRTGARQIVVPPVQVRRGAGGAVVRVWPLFFYSDEPGGSSWTLLPLAHRSRAGPRTTTILPLVLSYARSDAQARTSQGLIGGLFFYDNAPQASTRALLPLVWHESSPDRAFTWIAPLTFYHRHRDANLLVAAPLLLHHHDRETSTTLSLAPPLYHHRSPGRRRLYLPPLLGYHRTGEDRWMALGPAYLYRDGEARGFGLAPLLFCGWSPERRHLALAPLLLYRSWSGADGATDRQAISPLLFYQRDAAARRTQLALLAPPYFRLRDPEREVDLAPPLLARWHERQSGATTWVGGPLVLHDSPRRTAQVLFPIFWRVADRAERTSSVLAGPLWLRSGPESSSQVLFPLFWRFDHRARKTSSTLLLPLAYHRRRADGSALLALGPAYLDRRVDAWHAGLAPLFFAGAGGAGGRDRPGLTSWRYHGLLPLYWHSATRPDRSFTWAAPLTFYSRRDQTRRLLAVPLFYHARRPGQQTTLATLPPLYLHRSPGRTRLYLPPLLAYHRTGARRSVGIGPAYYHDHGDATYLGLAPLLFAGWSGQRRHLVLFPALWHVRSPGRSTWVVGPAYRHRRGDEVRGGLVPLVFHRRTPRSFRLTTLPLFHYGSERTEAGALARRTLLTPAGLFEQDRAAGRTQLALLAPPYYRRRDPRWEIDLAPPLFGRVRDRKEHVTRTMIGPFFSRSGPRGDRARILFPLVWRLEEPVDAPAGASPGGGGVVSTTVVFPLFLRRRQPDGAAVNLAGPVFWSTRPGAGGGYSAGLAPLLFFGRGGPRRHAVLFPLVWHFDHREADESFTLAGLYSHRRSGPTTEHAVWPLLHVRRTVDPARGDDSLTASLMPLLHYRRRGDRSLLLSPLGGFSRTPEQTRVVAGPIYWSSSAQERTLAAAPLVFATWERGGFARRHRLALVPALYYSRQQGETTSLCTPLFGFARDRGARSTLWYAGPYLAHRSPRASLDLLAPPLFLRHRDHARQRTTVFALPGYFGRWSPGRSAHLLPPLLWRFSRPEQSSTVVFPALWDFHRPGVSRTTVVFPLYWRHRDEELRSDAHLLPLVWVRTRGRGAAGRATDAVVFPLFWRFAGDTPDHASTVAFPLYWSFSRGQRRATVIFPLYWDFARGSRRTTVALNTLFIRDRRAGTYDFHFLPLLRLQRKRPTDFKIDLLAGLFGYERIGRNRGLKLLLIPIRLRPTPFADARRR